MTKNQSPTEKCNKHEDPSNDYKWFLRIVSSYFFIGGSLLSIAVLFFIIHTESGRTLASNPMLREFILNTFPNAQLWVYSTLKFKQEIVLIYFYYVLLLLWAGGIVIYLFIYLFLIGEGWLRFKKSALQSFKVKKIFAHLKPCLNLLCYYRL